MIAPSSRDSSGCGGDPRMSRRPSRSTWAFDLLELDGRDLRREPLKVRRRLLERLLRGHVMIFAARRLSKNGLKAWEEAVARGFEGLVAKNPDSRYVPGRTLAWLKVKQPKYREVERGFYKP
jgi:bifunctional non-homologous end joining protein LigD